jgi:DNA-binding NarL/FixJ family response regulator
VPAGSVLLLQAIVAGGAGPNHQRAPRFSEYYATWLSGGMLNWIGKRLARFFAVAHQSQIKIAVLEPQQLMREALTALLKKSRDIVVVGDAGHASQLLDMMKADHPDVVLVALDGWGDREADLLHEIPHVAEQTATIVLTSEADVDLHARVIALGAMGVVLKTQSFQVLAKAVRKVRAGELWLERSEAAAIISRLTRKRAGDDPDSERIASLTARERQIMLLVTEGLTNQDVAARLSIRETTARNHVTSILDKLQLKDRFQLVVYAFRRGLVRYAQPSFVRGAGPSILAQAPRAAEALIKTKGRRRG